MHFHLTFFLSRHFQTEDNHQTKPPAVIWSVKSNEISYSNYEKHTYTNNVWIKVCVRTNAIATAQPNNHGVLVLYPMVFVVTAYAQYGVLTICSGILWDTMNISNISPRVIVAFKFKKFQSSFRLETTNEIISEIIQMKGNAFFAPDERYLERRADTIYNLIW